MATRRGTGEKRRMFGHRCTSVGCDAGAKCQDPRKAESGACGFRGRGDVLRGSELVPVVSPLGPNGPGFAGAASPILSAKACTYRARLGYEVFRDNARFFGSGRGILGQLRLVRVDCDGDVRPCDRRLDRWSYRPELTPRHDNAHPTGGIVREDRAVAPKTRRNRRLRAPISILRGGPRGGIRTCGTRFYRPLP
jgi:hypothetical protein